MSKRRIILSILIGLVVIWGVSGMFITKRHAEQQAVQEAKEERRVQQKCAEYLVHHYEGIKTLEFGKLSKPNSIGGGTYGFSVAINGNRDKSIVIGSDNKESFDSKGPEIEGMPMDFPKGLNIVEKNDDNRSITGVKIKKWD